MAQVRTMKTAAEQALASAFAAAKPKLPGKGAVAALREDAFRRFDANGLPHRRVEEWKYTDLRAWLREAQPLAAPPDAKAKAAAKDSATLFDGIPAQILVFVDGAFVPELSDLSPQSGVTIGSLGDALAQGDVAVTAHVGQVVENKDPALALNTAMMADGAVIRVAEGAKPEKSIHLIFKATQSAAVFTRSLLILGKGATLTLFESHDSAAAQVNAAFDIVLGDEARLDHIKTTRARNLHVSSLMAAVGTRATFNSFAFTPEGALVRNQSFIRFNGKDTQAAIGGATLLKGKEHVDSTLVIEHLAPGCTSRERFRAVLDGESRSVFQGKIIVAPEAQQTDARMVSNALLLSDEAEADNKPELEIFADDVQCGHGATAGALDKDLLFYLRARGITEREAQALLIQAFIGDSIETVGHEGARDAINAAAAQWLAGRG